MRTTTAVTTSPFLTEPCGAACLTVRDDHVADAGVAPARAAAHADAEDLARAGVVGDLQACLVLDHYCARSTTSTRRQRLVRDSGRRLDARARCRPVRVVRSSCACSVVELRTTFP